ncbi:MAG: hypothetical protein JOZ09_03965, partial [Pseudonocardiales bacterium]|nr:hypothetical protein [Pseudonocardiales bacterium]
MPDDHRRSTTQVTAVDDQFGTHRLGRGVLVVAELDGFDDEQESAGDEVAAEGEHAE